MFVSVARLNCPHSSAFQLFLSQCQDLADELYWRSMSNCTVHTLLKDNILPESNCESASLMQISFCDFTGAVELQHIA